MGWRISDGMAIDLAAMNVVTVDPIRRIARIDAGLSSGAVIGKASRCGTWRVPPFRRQTLVVTVIEMRHALLCVWLLSNLEDTGTPANLSGAAVFKPYLEQMLRLSPTFRSQCQRLRARPSVRVKLRLEDLQRRPSFRARTVVERDHGVVVAADIFLYPSADATELIAHEIEHVLEQLDGVDLEAQAGSGYVWKRDDGAFETRRATEAGLRVRREVTEGSKAKKNSR